MRLIFKHCVLRYSAAEEGKFEALLILGFLSFRKFSSISLFFFRRSRQEPFVSKNLLKMIMYELLYGSSPVEDEKRTFNLRYRNGRSRATHVSEKSRFLWVKLLASFFNLESNLSTFQLSIHGT